MHPCIGDSETVGVNRMTTFDTKAVDPESVVDSVSSKIPHGMGCDMHCTRSTHRIKLPASQKP